MEDETDKGVEGVDYLTFPRPRFYGIDDRVVKNFVLHDRPVEFVEFTDDRGYRFAHSNDDRRFTFNLDGNGYSPELKGIGHPAAAVSLLGPFKYPWNQFFASAGRQQDDGTIKVSWAPTDPLDWVVKPLVARIRRIIH